MLQQRMLILSLTLLVACAAEVTPSDVVDDELDVPTPPTRTPEPKYTDAEPAPLYETTPDPTPAYDDDEPAPTTPVKPTPVMPEPAPVPVEPTPVPVMPTPVPVEPTPAPEPVKLTACKLPSGVLLTCASRAVYQRDLYWIADTTLVGYTCNVPAADAVQCKPGAACYAVTSDGTTEKGVCK